jgi:PP-loop superfamily ATP-utilizing enzyme
VEIFKRLGFTYVTLDLEGYRQGSLNARFVNLRT